MSALIGLAYLSLLVLSLLDNIRGPFFPEVLSDLHLNGSLGSMFFATTSLFAFIGSWSSHRLLQQRSSLFLMGLASVIAAAGFAAISVSVQLPLLLLSCALFGWGYGAINLAQNLMVYESAPVHLRRRLFSGLHGMYGLAALLAPLIASLFRSFGFSWRQCFAVLALLPALLFLVSLRFKSPRPAVEQVRVAMTRLEWRHCLLFALMMAGYLWGEVSISTRLVLWSRSALGYSPNAADLLLSGFFLTLLAGRIVFTFVHFSKIDNWRILQGSAALAAVTYLLALLHSPLWMVVVGLCMAPFFPVAMEQISTSFHAKSAQALGFILGFGSLSIVVMHLVLGVLSDAYGVGQALMVAPVALLIIALALTFSIPRMASRKSR